jgi:hypothetical protein
VAVIVIYFIAGVADNFFYFLRSEARVGFEHECAHTGHTGAGARSATESGRLITVFYVIVFFS